MKKIKNVKVVELLQSEFDELRTKFNNIFYCCMDTGRIYRGKTQVGDGIGDKLPPVTAEDDGKLLGVVDGAWDKTHAPSNDFVVTYTPGMSFTCDKTYAEIKAAYDADKIIIAKVGDNVASFAGVISDNRNIRFVYFLMNSNNTVAGFRTINHNPDNQITETETKLS